MKISLKSNLKTGIFLDLDGTLLNHESQISDQDLLFLQKLKKQSWLKLYLITGKTEAKALKYYQKLNLDTKLISSMGKSITLPLCSSFAPIIHSLSYELVDRVLKIFDSKYTTNYLIETQHGAFAKYQNDSHVIQIIGPEFWISKKEIKSNLIINLYLELKLKKLTTLNQLITKYQTLIPELDFTYWNLGPEYTIMVVAPKNINKAFAMKKVVEIDNLQQTIALGDGYSDLKMLKQATLGIAMLNADPALIKQADLVTNKDHNHHGVSNILAQIFDL